MDLPLWKNHYYDDSVKWTFFSLENLCFYLEHQQTIILRLFSPKPKKYQILNFQLNHGLTPLEKSLIWRLCKMDILLSLESLSFYLEHQQTIFLGLFCLKTSKDQISIFQVNSWVNPFRKITTMVTL